MKEKASYLYKTKNNKQNSFIIFTINLSFVIMYVVCKVDLHYEKKSIAEIKELY